MHAVSIDVRSRHKDSLLTAVNVTTPGRSFIFPSHAAVACCVVVHFCPLYLARPLIWSKTIVMILQ